MLDGTWHHVAAVFDGTNFDYYVDGDFYATDAPGLVNTLTTRDVVIGTGIRQAYGVHNLARWTTGLIDDVQIYSGAVTAGQTAYLNDNPGVAIPEPSTVVLMLMACIGLLAYRKRK